MPRDNPPIAVPAIKFTTRKKPYKDQKAIFFGGAPRLPEENDWPRRDGEPLHFYCQIDLTMFRRLSDRRRKRHCLTIFRPVTKVSLHAEPFNGPEGIFSIFQSGLIGRA